MKKAFSIFAAASAFLITISMFGCTSGSTVQSTSAAESAGTVSADSADDLGLITSGTITMATNALFEPFEYYEGNNIVGIDVDIANDIANEMGVKLKVNDMDFDSVVASVSTGKFDMGVAGLTKTGDRSKLVDFSDPYYDATQVILVLSSNTAITGKDSLSGKKIAVQTGTTGDTDATDITGDANVQRFNSPTDAVTNLINGKSDAVIIDSLPASIYVSQNSKLKMISGGFDTEEYCIAVKKGNSVLLAQINKSIADLKSSGKLDEIIKKYS